MCGEVASLDGGGGPSSAASLRRVYWEKKGNTGRCGGGGGSVSKQAEVTEWGGADGSSVLI